MIETLDPFNEESKRNETISPIIIEYPYNLNLYNYVRITNNVMDRVPSMNL